VVLVLCVSARAVELVADSEKLIADTAIIHPNGVPTVIAAGAIGTHKLHGFAVEPCPFTDWYFGSDPSFL
jgi:hypothetical protein